MWSGSIPDPPCLCKDTNKLHKMTIKKPKNIKKRADTYEPKVKFDGTFKDMIKISIKDADKKKAKTPPKKS